MKYNQEWKDSTFAPHKRMSIAQSAVLHRNHTKEEENLLCPKATVNYLNQ
jgi:hypothetical protein